MTDPVAAAVEKAAAILLEYRTRFGPHAFPTIKGKLWPIVVEEARKNGVDKVEVREFDESMHPVIGQVRRMSVQPAAYAPVETHGRIYLSPDIHLNWQRWVQMKEASHLLLDKAGDFVSNDTDIDKLLTCFAQFEIGEVNDQIISEARASVCANEMLFPFAMRVRFKRQYDKGDISSAAIAARAAIPSEMVKHVMGPKYWAMAEKANTGVVAKSVAGQLKIAKG